jgi:hypothetical protein
VEYKGEKTESRQEHSELHKSSPKSRGNGSKVVTIRQSQGRGKFEKLAQQNFIYNFIA